MGKRFYIEVTEACAGELKTRGITEAQIMVVDDDSTPQRHKALLQALAEVTGVTADRIYSHERTRYAVLARTIYIHYANIDGDGREQISKDIGRDKWAINFYLRDYYNKIEGDMEFKKADARIAALLEANPEWSPPKAIKLAVGKKKRQKRRKKGRRIVTKFVQPRNLPRQLEIPF